MIFITGDTHADFSRFTRKNFPEQENLSKDDIVIIAGDFGGIWFGTNDSFRLKAGVAFLGETYSFSDQLFILTVANKEIVTFVLHCPFAPEVKDFC